MQLYKDKEVNTNLQKLSQSLDKLVYVDKDKQLKEYMARVEKRYYDKNLPGSVEDYLTIARDVWLEENKEKEFHILVESTPNVGGENGWDFFQYMLTDNGNMLGFCFKKCFNKKPKGVL